MLRSVFVPLDGSAFGEQALPIAYAVALRAGAEITLAHVHVPAIHVTMGNWNLAGVPMLDERADEEARARDQRYLEQLRSRSGLRGLRVSCRVLNGAVAPALIEAATAEAADLVVLTTHGRGAFGRVWIGSVADAVIRHGGVPTLLVRPLHAVPERPVRDAAPFEPRHILVALDGSDLSKQALGPALDLAALYHARLTLLRVVEPLAVNAGAPDLDMAELDQQYQHSEDGAARAYLRGIAAPLQRMGHSVETRIEHGQPALAITQAARELGVDVVALATHGRGGLSRLLMGSVADRVVRAAEQPVLVVRPQLAGNTLQAETAALQEA